jgi:predicted HTH transcriptional regulator
MIRPKKDDEYIRALLKLPEGETLDFKQSITSPIKIAKTLVAFANTKGGKIAIGISDRKRILGIDEEEEIFMVEKAISEYSQPPVLVIFEVYEVGKFEEEEIIRDRNILIVNIPKSTQKHYVVDKGKQIRYKRKLDRTVPDTDLE